MSTDFNDIDIDNDSFCYLIYKRVEAVFQPLPDTIKYGAISFLEVQKIDFIPAFARGELERLIQGKFNDVKNVKILSIEEVNEFSDEARLQLYRDCKKNFYHSNDIWFIVKSFIKEIKSFSRSCIGDSAPRRSQAPSVAKEDNNHSPRWEAVQTIKAAGEIPAPDFGDGGAAGMVAAADRARLVDSNDKIADNSDYLPKIYNLLQNRLSDKSTPPKKEKTLDDIPEYDESIDWIEKKEFSKRTGLQIETLKVYRTKGRKTPDNTAGIDIQGNVWRKKGERDLYYYSPWSPSIQGK